MQCISCEAIACLPAYWPGSQHTRVVLIQPYALQDDVQSGHVEVQGLRAETRFVSGELRGTSPDVHETQRSCCACRCRLESSHTGRGNVIDMHALSCLRLFTWSADAAARLAHWDQSGMDRKRKMQGTRESSVLDPCRLVLDFKLASGGTGLGVPHMRHTNALPCSNFAVPFWRCPAALLAWKTSPASRSEPVLVRLSVPSLLRFAPCQLCCPLIQMRPQPAPTSSSTHLSCASPYLPMCWSLAAPWHRAPWRLSCRSVVAEDICCPVTFVRRPDCCLQSNKGRINQNSYSAQPAQLSPPRFLVQPKPDAPLTSCTQFERVWSFDPAHLFAGQQSGVLAVSLAVTGAEGGVTVWRAKTPTGYGVTGDIVTPGTTQASTPLMFDAEYQSLVHGRGFAVPLARACCAVVAWERFVA